MKTSRVILILLFIVAPNMRANLTVSNQPAPRVVEHGAELAFSGTLTNTSAAGKLFLNDLLASFTGPSAAYLSSKTNAYFVNVPGILWPGESYTGVLFRVAVSSLTPPNAYSGTITLRGGTDIFATTNLATVNLNIASPVAGIVASDPIACEFGPDSGTFTVARTGSSALALNVPIATSGTAANGVTYQTVPSSVTIPAGSASASIAIIPHPDLIAQGDRTATVTLGASGGFASAENAAATVVIRDKPIDEWRFDSFAATANSPATADLTDADGDGVRSITEYALNLEPLSPDGAGLPPVSITDGFLTLSYVPKSWATDLVYLVEASTDLVHWSAIDVAPVDVWDRVPADRVTLRWTNPVSQGNRAWLRLSIIRIP